MSMGQASAGLQAGAAESETLIVVRDRRSNAEVHQRGLGGRCRRHSPTRAQRRVGRAGSGRNVIADAKYYTLTKNGLQAGAAVAGTQFWKDKDLN